jgi:hypothetical protein
VISVRSSSGLVIAWTQAWALHRASLHSRHANKDALLQAGLTLAAELSLPAVLQRIVELAGQVTDASYGPLGVLGPTARLPMGGTPQVVVALPIKWADAAED